MVTTQLIGAAVMLIMLFALPNNPKKTSRK